MYGHKGIRNGNEVKPISVIDPVVQMVLAVGGRTVTPSDTGGRIPCTVTVPRSTGGAWFEPLVRAGVVHAMPSKTIIIAPRTCGCGFLELFMDILAIYDDKV